MNHLNRTLAFAVATVLASGLALADIALPPPPLAHPPAPLVLPRPKPRASPHHLASAIPQADVDTASPNPGFSTSDAFSAAGGAVANAGTALTPPVTVSGSGATAAFTVTETGSGKAVSSTIVNAASLASALSGQTNGKGAGVAGTNSGTAGPAGKFTVTNPSSNQIAVYATTAGTASAVQGTVTATNSFVAAITGTSTVSAFGVGVEGDGGSSGYGVYGLSNGVGVFGDSQSGVGVYGSTSGVNSVDSSSVAAGVQGESNNAVGVSGDDAGSGTGVYGLSTGGIGVYGVTYANTAGATTTAAGVRGQSTNAVGVYGNELGTGVGIYGEAMTTNATAIQAISQNGRALVADDFGSGTAVEATSVSGYGILASSNTGYAGYFQGNAVVTGTLTVHGMSVSSDRKLKAHFAKIDGNALLGQIDALPISSWDYKDAPNERHIGPMAQDFHAAFGLNGTDDTHISEVDIVGVSLAAIKELNQKMKEKDLQLAQIRSDSDEQLRRRDSQIAELRAQTAAQAQTLSDLANALSARMTALESQYGATTQTAALERSRHGPSSAPE